MEKAFDFIRSLKPNFLDLLGYPTLKIYSDYCEVYFDSSKTIRNLEVLSFGSDEFRMFPSDGSICYVFTFYND